jgi:hypothetical protein
LLVEDLKLQDCWKEFCCQKNLGVEEGHLIVEGRTFGMRRVLSTMLGADSFLFLK